MLAARQVFLSRYSVAVIVSVLTLLLRFLLMPLLNGAAPLLVFILPVLFSAWYGGLRPGLLATALCTIVGTFFFVQPQFSLGVLDIANWTRIAIFVIEGICISGLSEALRSAKQRAEQFALTLKDSEEQYRFLVESVKDYAIFGLDADGYITSWNSGAELIGGYRAAEALGRHFSLFYLDADLAQDKPARDLQCAATEGRCGDTRWLRRKDGHLFWADVLITAFNSAENRSRGFSVVIRDMTQQKQSEQNLQESYGLLQTVIEGTGDAVFAKNRQGQYQLVNSATIQILGKPKEEILEKDDTELLPLEVATFLQQLDRTVMETGMSQTFEEELPIAGEMHTFLTTKDPYRNAEGDIMGVIGIARDITDRIRAEATQRQLLKDLSDVKFALDQAAILVITDTEGVITDVNEKFCKISKFSRAELIGQTHRLVNSGYHSREFFRHLWATITQGKVWHGEIKNRAKDGATYWVDTTIVPLLDESGKPFQYFAIRFDITARKQAEELLTQEKSASDLERKRLRILLDLLPVGVGIADATGKLLELNASMRAIWGQEVFRSRSIQEYGEYIGWWAKTGERVADEDWALARAVLRGETVVNEEIDIETFDRQRKTILNSAVPIRNELGEVVSAVAVNVDITQRKQTEESLRRSAQRLETLQQIDRAILAVSSPSEIAQVALFRLSQAISYQQAALILFNFETNKAQVLAGQVDAQPAGTVLPIDALSSMESLRYRETVRYIEDLGMMLERPPLLEHQFIEGMRSVLIVALVVENDLIGDLYLFADRPFAFNLESREIAQEVANQLAIVIQQAQLREQLQRYTEELEQRVVERTAALQEAIDGLETFNYSASHDLRGPLRAMRGLSQALLEDYGHQLDPTAQLYAQGIADSAQQAEQLVADLLNYGRLSRADITVQPINLSKILAEELAHIADDLQAKNVQINVEEPLPDVMAHHITLTQSILNLLTNAVKFGPSDRQPHIQIWAEHRDGWVRLWIEDNGIGIAPEHQERIFQVFERLHTTEAYPGTGVGLAIVRKGIERMGGRVGVESVLGEGSRFWVELREATA